MTHAAQAKAPPKPEPPPKHVPAPGPKASGPEAWIDHPSGFLALAEQNQRFVLPGQPGFLAFREQGRHLVLFGGAHAPESKRRPLLEAFLAHAKAKRRRPLAVQVRADQASLFAELGFTTNKLGASYALAVDAHGLGGAKRVKLRQKVRRAQRLGLRVLELGVERPRDAASFARLAHLSAAWLQKKGKPELEFMVGWLGEPADRRRRVFAVADGPDDPAAERWVGFISYVPVWGQRPGWLHDLTRRLPDAPPGTMELCNHVALERFRDEGAGWLHLGFTPFLPGPERELPGASRVASWVIRQLAAHGKAVYPAHDQVRYKRKWAPTVIESEWVAFRPLSLRAIWDLLRLTRSI